MIRPTKPIDCTPPSYLHDRGTDRLLADVRAYEPPRNDPPLVRGGQGSTDRTLHEASWASLWVLAFCLLAFVLVWIAS